MARPVTIFLIDDDTDDHDFFLSVMQSINPDATCLTALNGREGMDKLIAQEVVPDIIFLDLNMPLMNGQEFLRIIKKDNTLKHIPIIILSTSADRKTMVETKKLGALHFITKPDNFGAWEAVLKSVLDELVS